MPNYFVRKPNSVFSQNKIVEFLVREDQMDSFQLKHDNSDFLKNYKSLNNLLAKQVESRNIYKKPSSQNSLAFQQQNDSPYYTMTNRKDLQKGEATKIDQLQLENLKHEIYQIKDQTKSDINQNLFKKQRSRLSRATLQSKQDYRLLNNSLSLDLQELNKQIFYPDKNNSPQNNSNKKKYTHKNQNLLAVDDLNLGEEVAFSMNSIEQDKNQNRKKDEQIQSMHGNSAKQLKFQQLLEKQQQMKKLKVLSNFVNSQMERIMLSKMNSEVSSLYVSGHNKFEGTVKHLQELQQEQLIKKIKEENEIYQKDKRKEIYKKLRDIQEFKQKLVFNRAEKKKKIPENNFIETIVYHSQDNKEAGFYTSRKLYIDDLDNKIKPEANKFFVKRNQL